MNNLLRIGFVGSGRVARGLALAFARAGERVEAVAGRNLRRAEACAQGIPGCRAMETPQQVIDNVDLVFLAVPDDGIAPLVASLGWRSGVMAVHCSGATDLSVLAPAQAAGASVGSFHPLLMFSDPEVAARALPGATVALEAGEPLLGTLESLVQRLGASCLRVPPGSRAAYHAASHYAAAFLCVLMEQAVTILAAQGMTGQGTRKALLSLAHSTLGALAQAEPAQAMAGVYARADAGTARRHLQALDAIDPEVASLYRHLARHSIDMAQEAGRIDRSAADAMRSLLGGGAATSGPTTTP